MISRFWSKIFPHCIMRITYIVVLFIPLILYGQNNTVTVAEAVNPDRKAAEEGDAEAQYNLGEMYRKERWDYSEAIKWYRKAAEQGHISSGYHLGVMYYNGEGTPKDVDEAIKWYRMAAKQGYTKAQYILGIMYSNGEGVVQNDAEAIRWYKKAAAQGHSDAQYNLELMYITGRGVREGDAKGEPVEPSRNLSAIGKLEKNFSSPVRVSRKSTDLLSPFRYGPESNAYGIYSLENDITFNVLDQVVVDPEIGGVTLIGHFDSRYIGRSIPYFQHLAVLLDHPRPRFSLEWTTASKTAVDALLKRLDDPHEMARLASGPYLTEDGVVTAAGRVIFPLLGIKPTKTGGLSGYLGANIESAEGSFASVRINGVNAGSPADRAGLKVGEWIYMLDTEEIFTPEALRKKIRMAGAGTAVKLNIQGTNGGRNTTITLGTATGDPWSDVDRLDMIMMIFREAGQVRQARFLEALGTFNGLIGTEHVARGWEIIYASLDITHLDVEYGSQFWDKKISFVDYQTKMLRAMCREMDNIFGFNGALSRVFERDLHRGPPAGIEAAFTELDRQLPPALKRAMQTVFRRNDEIQFTPEMMESTFGVQPRVRPKFIGIPPQSEVGRVLYMADYRGKHLLNMPELQNEIPEYRTLYAHRRSNPEEWKRMSDESRLWISVDSLDFSQSEDSNTLLLEDIQMRFNIRDINNQGTGPLGYENLLSSLYDQFAQRFSELHELREMAKLAAVAPWLKGRYPKIAFPKEGLVHWDPPEEIAGLAFLTWSPNSELIVATFMGGVDLVVPSIGPSGPVNVDQYVEAIPRRAEIRPMWTGNEIPRIQEYHNETLAKVLRRKGPTIPLPIAGWTVKARRGQQTIKLVQAASVELKRLPMDLEQSIELGRKLDELRGVAEECQRLEQAMNAITARNIQGQQQWQELGEELISARQQFIDEARGAVIGPIQEMFETMQGDAYRQLMDEAGVPWKEVEQLRAKIGEHKERLETWNRRYDAYWKMDPDAQEKEMESLLKQFTDATQALVKDLKVPSGSRFSKVLKPLRRVAPIINTAEKYVGLGESLFRLGKAWVKVNDLTDITEEDLRILSDEILPLKKLCDDRITKLKQDPQIELLLQKQ